MVESVQLGQKDGLILKYSTVVTHFFNLKFEQSSVQMLTI